MKAESVVSKNPCFSDALHRRTTARAHRRGHLRTHALPTSHLTRATLWLLPLSARFYAMSWRLGSATPRLCGVLRPPATRGECHSGRGRVGGTKRLSGRVTMRRPDAPPHAAMGMGDRRPRLVCCLAATPPCATHSEEA